MDHADETIRYGMAMARLSRDDWISAAYRRFSDSGLDAVAVEPVARMLHATKGSFYWHFADRAALIDAVLEEWEARETDAVIATIDPALPARDRLEQLIWTIAHRTPDRGGEATLYTAAERNGASETVAKVIERRVAYVAAVLRELDMDAAEARSRAITVVASVVGFQQLVTPGWEALAERPERIAASLVEMALGPHRDERGRARNAAE